MKNWLLLILSLPTENTTVRMRVWRAVKIGGAVVLRDGVYLLPNQGDCKLTFQRIADKVRETNGSVFLMESDSPDDQDFPLLFDRTQDYLGLSAEIDACHQSLITGVTASELIKPIRKLRKTLDSLIKTDFFPTLQQAKTQAALTELASIVDRLLSPNEPSAVEREIAKLDRSLFQKRRWATRQRPWVDRLACAWLIRRHIDPDAEFTWLASMSDCPADAIGFDFDGAQFTHVGERVTFETLLAAFDLESPALIRLGRLVHCLDVGGIRPAEAGGIEQVLTGLKDSIPEDGRLLDAANNVFDGLYAAFRKEEIT